MTAAKAPQVLTDPTLSKVFAKILEVSGSGISPISLGMGNSMSAQSTDVPDVETEVPVAPTLPVVPGQPAQ